MKQGRGAIESSSGRFLHFSHQLVHASSANIVWKQDPVDVVLHACLPALLLWPHTPPLASHSIEKLS